MTNSNTKMKKLTKIRLAHFVPIGNNAGLSKQTKGDLLLNALYYIGTFADINEIENTINNRLGCIVDKNEILELIDEAIRNECIIKIKETYSLSTDIYNKLKQENDNFKTTQGEAIQVWYEEQILTMYPQLTQEVIEGISEKLIEFLNNLFLMHGAESLMLINGEIKHENLLSINDIINNLKYTDILIEEICKKKLYSFLTSNNPKIKRFILLLIDKVFRYLAIICERETFENLKDSIEGKTIYLDTSTVYRLLKLQGIRRFNVIQEVIALCKEFKFKLKVDNMTLKELERRINFDSKILRDYPTPVNLSGVGCEFLTDENFISAYWEQSKLIGISTEDFIAKYKHIDILIQNEGIEIERDLIEFTEEFNERQKRVLTRINLRDDHKKSIAACEHDAYIVTLIEYLRKDQLLNVFIDSNFWLLTTDQFLIRFQKNENLFKDKVSIAILPTQLIHILRFVRPKDERFDEIFLEFFSKSFIGREGCLNNENIQKILARISLYEGYTQDLAKKILSDQIFTQKYIQSQTIAEKEDLIHHEIVKKAQELEVAIAAKDKIVQEQNIKINDLESNFNRNNSLVETQIANLKGVAGERENDIEKITLLNRDLMIKVKEKEKEINSIYKDLEEAQRQSASTVEIVEGMNKKIEELEIVEKERKNRNTVIFNIIKRVILVSLYLGINYILYKYYFFNIPKENKLTRSIILTSTTLEIIPVIKISFDNKKAEKVGWWIGLFGTIIALFYSIM